MKSLSANPQDFVAGFTSETLPVAGRIVRLGPGTISPILHRHSYPENLGEILGQSLILATLVGAGLKFEGRVLTQAEGDGPVSMLVGEYDSTGGLRAYSRFEHERWAYLEKLNKGGKPHMPQLFGPSGALALIIIRDDPNAHPYQGVVPLVKASMAECAQDYFHQSEQVETCLAMAVRKDAAGDWQGAGLMMQQIAGDDTRGDTAEGWLEAKALFSTLTEDELLSEETSAEQLLYRLFHEGGVRMEAPRLLDDRCTCNEDRLRQTLSGMPDESLHEMVEPDGMLKVDCQFCARHYDIPISAVTGSLN